ncbi:hypothetical protein ACIPJS_39140 [Streptomyces sp. NPDC086783]|uniref:hypothetical protein n=1 Tax=Streptomyces sp. NPDC086783 TaxID=3365758 RepID=UPI003800E2AB
MTGAGQQLGAGDDGPGQAALPGGPDKGASERGQERFGVEDEIEVRDQLGEFSKGIAIGVGAVRAARFAVADPAHDASFFVAARAKGWLLKAG